MTDVKNIPKGVVLKCEVVVQALTYICEVQHCHLERSHAPCPKQLEEDERLQRVTIIAQYFLFKLVKDLRMHGSICKFVRL